MLAICLTLALATRGADLGDRVVEEARKDWLSLADDSIQQNRWRDKNPLVGELDDLLAEERSGSRDRKRAARALAEWAEDESDSPHLTWRVHELTARLWEGADAEAELTALEAAIEAYPEEPYDAPRQQSYFQHLLNRDALARWDTEGVEAALDRLRSVAADDARCLWIHETPLEARFARDLDLPRFDAFLEELAQHLRDRAPEAADALTAYEPPDLRFVDDDRRKAYLVLEREQDAEALPLVVVLPGGNGQALEFRPWMEELCTPLLDRFRFAILSAPVWNSEQASEWVWVTADVKRTYRAKFAVEDFADEVATALGADDRAWLFAWSSGGPATYRILGRRNSPFAGAYVLASVFHPDRLDLKRFADRRIFLETGRSDRVTALRFAEQAARVLTDHGATTRLETFDGGHGFAMPDPAASLARALAWLVADG